MATLPKQAYGITVPIKHGTGGYFNQSYSVLEQIKSNLFNLLQTRKGERRMNPTFGSDLYKVIFEFENEQLPGIIESIIRTDIATWMPIVTVRDVNVDIRNELVDIYTVHVQVKFTVESIGVTSVQTMDLNLDKPNL